MKRPFPCPGFQLELSHHKERPERIHRVVENLSTVGYNLCQLNLENAYF